MKDKFLQLRVDAAFLRKLDDVRRLEPELPSRTKLALRVLNNFLDDQLSWKAFRESPTKKPYADCAHDWKKARNISSNGERSIKARKCKGCGATEFAWKSHPHFLSDPQ